MTLIILGIASLWLGASIVGGLLFARLAKFGARSDVPVQRAEVSPQLQLVPPPPLRREHAA